MNFNNVLHFICTSFKEKNIDCALIGGFALQFAGITRTTQDIDLLIVQKDKEPVKGLMKLHGYNLLHESEDVLNFLGKQPELGRVDFLISHRKYTLSMLKRAEIQKINQSTIKVLQPEDLIGLKVQASANDPERYHKDIADIRALINKHYKIMDKILLKEYFALFGKEQELESIVKGK